MSTLPTLGVLLRVRVFMRAMNRECLDEPGVHSTNSHCRTSTSVSQWHWFILSAVSPWPPTPGPSLAGSWTDIPKFPESEGADTGLIASA